MKIKNITLLLLTAIIWGFGFVAQKSGMEHVGPYTFNCVRSFIASVFLIPVILLLERFKIQSEREHDHHATLKTILIGGVSCGVVLACASTLQQLGINYTEVGKAGFITACYIILVPLLGLFFKKSCSWLLAIAVILAVIALYLLCLPETQGADFSNLSINKGDILVMFCALLFAVHILVIDHFAPQMDCALLSCIQFFMVGLLCSIPMLTVEGLPSPAALRSCLSPLLYSGVMSCGIAYTMQIFGQKDFNPTIASILMSLESTFAVLGGWLILGERLTGRQFTGCALMFTATILAQIPVKPSHEKSPAQRE